MDEIIDASATATRQASNIPEYGVSELSDRDQADPGRRLRGAIRSRAWGEITELKLYSSGHAYFSSEATEGWQDTGRSSGNRTRVARRGSNRKTVSR